MKEFPSRLPPPLSTPSDLQKRIALWATLVASIVGCSDMKNPEGVRNLRPEEKCDTVKANIWNIPPMNAQNPSNIDLVSLPKGPSETPSLNNISFSWDLNSYIARNSIENFSFVDAGKFSSLLAWNEEFFANNSHLSWAKEGLESTENVQEAAKKITRETRTDVLVLHAAQEASTRGNSETIKKTAMKALKEAYKKKEGVTPEKLEKLSAEDQKKIEERAEEEAQKSFKKIEAAMNRHAKSIELKEKKAIDALIEKLEQGKKDIIKHIEEKDEDVKKMKIKELEKDFDAKIQELQAYKNILAGDTNRIKFDGAGLAASYINGQAGIGVGAQARIEHVDICDDQEINQFIEDHLRIVGGVGVQNGHLGAAIGPAFVFGSSNETAGYNASVSAPNFMMIGGAAEGYFYIEDSTIKQLGQNNKEAISQNAALVEAGGVITPFGAGVALGVGWKRQYAETITKVTNLNGEIGRALYLQYNNNEKHLGNIRDDIAKLETSGTSLAGLGYGKDLEERFAKNPEPMRQTLLRLLQEIKEGSERMQTNGAQLNAVEEKGLVLLSIQDAVRKHSIENIQNSEGWHLSRASVGVFSWNGMFPIPYVTLLVSDVYAEQVVDIAKMNLAESLFQIESQQRFQAGELRRTWKEPNQEGKNKEVSDDNDTENDTFELSREYYNALEKSLPNLSMNQFVSIVSKDEKKVRIKIKKAQNDEDGSKIQSENGLNAYVKEGKSKSTTVDLEKEYPQKDIEALQQAAATDKENLMVSNEGTHTKITFGPEVSQVFIKVFKISATNKGGEQRRVLISYNTEKGFKGTTEVTTTEEVIPTTLVAQETPWGVALVTNGKGEEKKDTNNNGGNGNTRTQIGDGGEKTAPAAGRGQAPTTGPQTPPPTATGTINRGGTLAEPVAPGNPPDVFGGSN